MCVVRDSMQIIRPLVGSVHFGGIHILSVQCMYIYIGKPVLLDTLGSVVPFILLHSP